jgi:hypothetical protein
MRDNTSFGLLLIDGRLAAFIIFFSRAFNVYSSTCIEMKERHDKNVTLKKPLLKKKKKLSKTI